MRVFITGANGFVGTNLSRFFLAAGHEVTGLVRNEQARAKLPPKVSCVMGTPMEPGAWQESVAGHDVLINLAGATAFKRWNAAYKKLLRDSRLLTTRNLVDAIPSSSRVTLFSTSGVGYYGFTEDEELDESAQGGHDFFAVLARDWEAEAFRARKRGVRVVTTRFGVVLGKDGGALAQMVRPFRFFVGGLIGSGRQWVSWIHIRDLCRAYAFVVEHADIQGPVNFAAPGPVRNRDFAQAIGKVLGRPSFMPGPAFMIRLVLGEFGSIILEGQRVVPGVLLSKGFSFDFPEIEKALRDLLSN
ncbi:MAG: TIGR01777 family protein [Desulfomonile tiedjei]|nr:TIGR01777 family protein [Desulfomonile tiedjei]